MSTTNRKASDIVPYLVHLSENDEDRWNVCNSLEEAKNYGTAQTATIEGDETTYSGFKIYERKNDAWQLVYVVRAGSTTLPWDTSKKLQSA